MSSKRVVFPDELLEDRRIETTIFTEQNDIFGIAVLSETDQDFTFTLRIYQLMWSKDEEAFAPVQELEAFRFLTRQQLEDFVKRLPEISGLEMLMLLNPLPEVH